MEYIGSRAATVNMIWNQASTDIRRNRFVATLLGYGEGYPICTYVFIRLVADATRKKSRTVLDRISYEEGKADGLGHAFQKAAFDRLQAWNISS